MSYIFEYALKSAENLLTIFKINALTLDERQSDKIWVENKHLVMQNLHGGLSTMAQRTSQEFVTKWVEDNFMELFCATKQAKVILSNEDETPAEVNSPLKFEGDLICESQVIDFLSPEFLAQIDTTGWDEIKITGLSKVIRCKIQRLNQEACFLRIVPIELLKQLKKIDPSEFKNLLKNAPLPEFFLFITKNPEMISPVEYFKTITDQSLITQTLDFVRRSRLVSVAVNREFNCFDVTFENKDSLFSVIDKLVDWFKVYSEEDSVQEAIELLYTSVRVGEQFTFAPNSSFEEFTAEKFKASPDKYFSSLESNVIKLVKDLVDTGVFEFETIKDLNFVKNKTALYLKEEWYSYVVSTSLKKSQKTGMEALEFLEQFYTPEDFDQRVQNPWSFESIESIDNAFTAADYVAWRVRYAQKSSKHEKWLLTRGNFINHLDLTVKDLKSFIEGLKQRFEDVEVNTLINHLVQSGITLKSRFIDVSLLDISMSTPTGLSMNMSMNHLKQFLRDSGQMYTVGLLQKKIDDKKPLASLQIYCLYAILAEVLFTADEDSFMKICDLGVSETVYGFKPEVIEKAWEMAQAVRGGFDAQKYLSISYAMTYFASVRKGKNLFSKRELVSVYVQNEYKSVKMVQIMHCEGIPGMQLASPFEKGFSWSNYDEISALARVTSYVNAETGDNVYYTSTKRMSAYLLAYSTKWDAKTLQTRLADTPAKSCARVVNQMAGQLNGTRFEFILKNFGVIRANRDKFVEYFEQNYDHMENILGAMIYFIRFKKFPHPGIVSMLNNMIGFMLDNEVEVESFDKYLDYINLSNKNKVNSYYIFESIRFARNQGVPKAKKIQAQTFEDTVNGVRIKLLEAGDLRALTIGAEVNCCQYYLGHASSCAEATYNNENYSVAVVENIDPSNGTRPLAEAALWISENTVVIDSIEGLRKDAAGYEKIANAFSNFIDQWHAQGLRVVLSTTDYGLTNQIRRKLSANTKYRIGTTDRPALPLRVYTDTSWQVYNIVKAS